MSQYRVCQLAWFGIRSNDISCSEENVRKQIFGQCSFTKWWVSNSWKWWVYRNKTFSEFRKKRKCLSRALLIKRTILWPGKLINESWFTWLRWLWRGVICRPEIVLCRKQRNLKAGDWKLASSRWLGKSELQTSEPLRVPPSADNCTVYIMRIIMAALIMWHSLDWENNRQHANN